MKLKLSIAVLLLVLIASCKKENAHGVLQQVTPPNYDTVFPLSYFPAYPGSFWIYTNGDTLKIENNYLLYESPYVPGTNWQGPDYGPMYMPAFKTNNVFFNGNTSVPLTYVHEYSISTVTYRLPFRTVLTDSVGMQFQTAEYYAGNGGYGKMITPDTAITVNGTLYNNVRVVINYGYNNSIGYLPWHYKEYYAKDIGLIKRDYRAPFDTTVQTVLELQSYFINQ